MKITDLLNESPIDMTGDPNDPVVYGHEKANPMSLKGRIMSARAQLKELAEMAESNDLVVWEKITQLHKGGMFMGLAQNLEQVRHGIEQLAAKRKQGGIGSRGIDRNIGEQGVAEGSFGSGYGSVFTLHVNTGEKPATKTKTKKFRREDDAVLWAEDYADQHDMFPNLKMEIQDENGNVVWELEESQGVDGKTFAERRKEQEQSK
jgi:hypothetical protein